jgi:hypothetical protein
MDHGIDVELILSKSTMDKVVKNLGQNGDLTNQPTIFDPSLEEAGMFPDPGMEPIMILACALSFSHLARLAFELWEKHRYKGLVIDARQESPKFYELQALERGHVLVIGSDGTTQDLRPANKSELGQLLKHVL